MEPTTRTPTWVRERSRRPGRTRDTDSGESLGELSPLPPLGSEVVETGYVEPTLFLGLEWSLQSVSSADGAGSEGSRYTFIHDGDEVDL